MEKTNYSLKGFKKQMGMDYMGFSATLLRDGKKIGSYTDFGDGGPINTEFINQEEEKMYTNFVKAQTYEYDGKTCTHNIDTYADVLIKKLEDEKLIKKLDNQVVFTLKSRPNVILSYKGQFSDKDEQYLIKSYGEDLNEIYNKKYSK